MNLPYSVSRNTNRPNVWILVAGLVILILGLALNPPQMGNQTAAFQSSSLNQSLHLSAIQPDSATRIIATPVQAEIRPTVRPVATPPGIPDLP